MTYYHVCINLDSVIKMAVDDPSFLTTIEDDGTQRPATRDEVIKAVAEAKAKGYNVLPPCDNVDKTGHCKGHK